MRLPATRLVVFSGSGQQCGPLENKLRLLVSYSPLARRLKHSQRFAQPASLTTDCIAQESAKDLVCPPAAPRRRPKTPAVANAKQFKPDLKPPADAAVAQQQSLI